jgi:beta-lactamase class C
MKSNAFILGLISLCFVANIANAQSNEPKVNPEPVVNRTIRQLMEKDHIPGVAVDLYIDGEPYSYYYGYRDLKHKLKVNSKTLFEIGALTKLFTCLLVAIEVNQNTVQLDNTLGELLPALKQVQVPAATISLEQLATNTSGLPLDSPLPQTDLFNINTVATLHQFLLNWQPAAPIGSQWAYSNFGMGLLGMSIEDKVGWPYKELLNKYVFKPLKIKDAEIDSPNWQFNYAQGYADGKPVPHWKMPMFPTAGAIEASPRDMQNFLSAALELSGTPSPIISAMELTQTAFVKTANFKQGLGWEIYPYSPKDPKFTEQEGQTMGPLSATQLNSNQAQYSPYLLMQKSGETSGFSSFIAVAPSRRTGVVILANSNFNNSADIENAGRSIMAQLSQS